MSTCRVYNRVYWPGGHNKNGADLKMVHAQIQRSFPAVLEVEPALSPIRIRPTKEKRQAVGTAPLPTTGNRHRCWYMGPAPSKNFFVGIRVQGPGRKLAQSAAAIYVSVLRHQGDFRGQAPGGGAARSRGRRVACGFRRHQQQSRSCGTTLSALHAQPCHTNANSFVDLGRA